MDQKISMVYNSYIWRTVSEHDFVLFSWFKEILKAVLCVCLCVVVCVFLCACVRVCSETQNQVF